MSLQGLKSATAGMKLVDTKAVFEQGRKAFAFMIEPRDNPMKTDRDRRLWQQGYEQARDQWANSRKSGGNNATSNR